MKKIIAVLMGLLFAVSVFAAETAPMKEGAAGMPEKVTKTAKAKKAKKAKKKPAAAATVVETPMVK